MDKNIFWLDYNFLELLFRAEGEMSPIEVEAREDQIRCAVFDVVAIRQRAITEKENEGNKHFTSIVGCIVGNKLGN